MDLHGADTVYEKIVGEQAEGSISDQPSGNEGANGLVLESFGAGPRKELFTARLRDFQPYQIDSGKAGGFRQLLLAVNRLDAGIIRQRADGLRNVRRRTREEECVGRRLLNLRERDKARQQQRESANTHATHDVMKFRPSPFVAASARRLAGGEMNMAD